MVSGSEEMIRAQGKILAVKQEKKRRKEGWVKTICRAWGPISLDGAREGAEKKFILSDVSRSRSSRWVRGTCRVGKNDEYQRIEGGSFIRTRAAAKTS